MAGTGFLTPGLLFINSGVDSEFKFLKTAFAQAARRGYTRFVEPACGAMAMCHMARQAGWEPAQMESSDVMLFSAVMGYALMGQRLDDLEVRIDGFEDEDLGDPATVIWAEAVCRAEAKAQRVYWAEIARGMRLDRDRHLREITTQLDKARQSIGGLRYQPLDLFDHLDQIVDDPQTIVSLNPPSTKSGYEKFFDTGGRVTWKEPPYALFDPVAGYDRLRRYMAKSQALLSIYEENQGGFEVEGAFVARGSMRKGKGDTGIARSVNYYIVSNRPDEMQDYVGGLLVIPWPGYPMERGQYRLLPDAHPITEATQVQIVEIPAAEANYYRLLWTHSFVGSQCIINLALLLDGYLTGVFGYDPTYVSSAGAFGRDSSAVAIVYGMTVPQRRFRFNRLLSRLAMARQTLSLVLSNVALLRCDHLVTAQLTKHPESKEYRGIMKLRTRKPDPHHGYRLIYAGPILEQDWPALLHIWLEDERRWQQKRKVAA